MLPTMGVRAVGVLLGLGVGVSACGPGAATFSDSGVAAVDARVVCTADEQCADDLFCNGVERCAPADPAADQRGCLARMPACGGGMCDEGRDACTECVDRDGDGACVDSDCDDGDEHRFPGNVEICDSAGRDEDCDPTTLAGPADTDLDGDDFVSQLCCNDSTCGTDCDDRVGLGAQRHPGADETCNGADDDCDGLVDETTMGSYYPDCDGDLHGTVAEPTLACREPSTPPDSCAPGRGGWSLRADDCDDTDPLVYPGAFERPNRRDDNCNGISDESYFVTGSIAPMGGATAGVTLRVLGGHLESAVRACGSTWCTRGGVR